MQQQTVHKEMTGIMALQQSRESRYLDVFLLKYDDVHHVTRTHTCQNGEDDV